MINIYSKNNKCKDCGKLISNTAIRCYVCANKGKNNPSYKDGLWSFNKHYCIDCGKEITRGHLRCTICPKKGKSNPNFGKKHPGMNKGDLNGSYIDGHAFDLYPIEFNDSLKESIRQRDNYECQNCSMTEEEHLIVIGKVLPIHHIDYDKNNCKDDNLITTCNQCNARANHDREYWKEFYQNKIKILTMKGD